MTHVINLEEVIAEIKAADRPACQWVSKEDVIQILLQHAKSKKALENTVTLERLS